MRVMSVNVGRIREATWKGKTRAMRLEFTTDRMRKTLAERFEHIAHHSEQEGEEF